MHSLSIYGASIFVNLLYDSALQFRLAPPVHQPNSLSSADTDTDRPNLVYVNFSPASHPIRKKVLKNFANVATYQVSITIESKP